MEIDPKKLPIVTDEEMVDDKGNPKKEAHIYEDKITCHPSLKDQLEEGLEFFFNRSRNND